MIKEVRGSGLMIGIELARRARGWARLNWRLIHLASEGLFPQLIVIPLHRDHGVITMAAGKNDVIKLLPPLTLSEPEAHRFLERARRGARPTAPADASKNWARRARHRDRDAAPPRATRRRSAAAGVDGAGSRPNPADADRRLARRRVPGHRRDRLHRRSPGAAAASQEGRQVRCLVRPSSDTSLLEQLDVELAVGDLTSSAFARARRRRLPLRVPLRRARVGLGDDRQEITRINVDRDPQPARRLGRRLGRALRPLQHHRRVRLSRWHGDRRDPSRHPVSELVRADQARMPRPRSAGRGRRPDLRR